MIRWIDGSLGTAAFSDPHTAGHAKLDVRELVDGSSNGADALHERIEAGLSMLAEGRPLVVCCEYGISRSNTIASAILARHRGMAFDDAFALVRQRVDEEGMDYGIVRTVRAVLEPGPAEQMTSGRVLVTGGTGFLGRSLSSVEHPPTELISLGSADIDLSESPFGFDALVRRHRPEVVIHLADPRLRNTHPAIGLSLAMLRNVTDVCGHHGVHLVVPSTATVFGGRTSEGDLTLDDDASRLPRGHHGLAKSLAEDLVGYLDRAGRLSATVLRFSTIYGPGSTMPAFLFRWADHLRAGRPVTTHRYRNGRPRVQLLHVADAAAALRSAAAHRIVGTFNISGATTHTTRQLARIVADTFDATVEPREIELDAEVANITLDADKARRLLEWEPQIELRCGLAEVVAQNQPFLLST